MSKNLKTSRETLDDRIRALRLICPDEGETWLSNVAEAWAHRCRRR